MEWILIVPLVLLTVFIALLIILIVFIVIDDYKNNFK